MKCLVMGQGKSGTSVIHQSILSALPDARGVFEPKDMGQDELDAGNTIVVKKLIDNFIPWRDLSALALFDRRVLIVRDPRDALISRMLYSVFTKEFIFDTEKVLEFINLLRRKENAPQSVSVIELFAKIQELEGTDTLQTVDRINRQTVNFVGANADRFLMQRYENFIDGEVATLQTYLGEELDPRVAVAPQLSRVSRTQGYGDWALWFTQEDIKFFRVFLAPVMGALGYDSWQQQGSGDKRISADHASAYVVRLVNEKRARRGMPPLRYNISQITAETSPVVAEQSRAPTTPTKRNRNCAEVRRRPSRIDNLVDQSPIFIGGTGRSGTTVLARMLGESAAYATVPFEIKLHTDSYGFPDLFAVRHDPSRLAHALKAFKKRTLAKWFERPASSGSTGLHQLLSRDELRDLLTTFVRGYPHDPEHHCRVLLQGLLGPLVAEGDKRAWVEMTPATIYHTPLLHRLYPHARFIHIFRDGRDVAGSVAARRWGPTTPLEGLDYWADLLRRAHAASREIPARQLLEVDFGRLVLTRRRQTFQAVCDFLRIENEGGHKDFFNSEFTTRRAHLGRWINQVPVEEQHAFNLRYTELLTQLRKEGVTCVPD